MANALLSYFSRILPGLFVGFGLLALLYRRAPARARIPIYVLLFTLFRDSLAPAGIWAIGGDPVLWMRFIAEPPVLFALAALSGLMVLSVLRFEPELARKLVWRRKPWLETASFGCLGAALISAPVLIIGFFIPVALRGGQVDPAIWPAAISLALVGNLVEELLFRGFLQGWFEEVLRPPMQVIVASGLSFAVAHGPLAASVGGLGANYIVAFTLYEGLICAWLRSRDGLWPAVLAHGLGIFIVSVA
jgi:membrane protease YdiL (CAAX protease family)